MRIAPSATLISFALCFESANGCTSERLLTTRELREPTVQNVRRRQVVIDDYGVTQVQPEITQVFVRYQNDKAKLNALEAAEAVVEDSANDNLVVLRMRQDRYESLKMTDNIDIEIDNKVEAFMDAHVEKLPSEAQQRHVAEEVPWGIKMIQADQLDAGSHDVTVCIIDTGFAQGHPDLPSSTTGTSTPERDFIWNEDLNGHGTHVAGVIAAVSGNSIGVVGAGSINLHITRGLDQFSAGYESDVRRAVEQCVNAGAKVISISLGSSIMSSEASELYTRVVEENGVLIVAAAGNLGHTGESHHAYPASHPSVISVAAVYEWGATWVSSNFSDKVELAAPGHRILSTSVSTSVIHTSDFGYPGQKVSGAPTNDVEGTLVDCGAGNVPCNGASGSICVLSRDESDLGTIIENCKNGGGIGAVIFNADESSTQNWSADSIIPAVGVEHLAGIDILSKVGTVCRLGFSNEDDEREYSYSYLSGTSMATPHVAAAAALVWSHFPQCTNHQIRHALAVTAQDKGIEGCDWDYGHGIVKAKDAYDFLLANDCSQGDWWQPTGTDTPVCEWSFPVSANTVVVPTSPSPTKRPTLTPTASPTPLPTKRPTGYPTSTPTDSPPTASPTTESPTTAPSKANTATAAKQPSPMVTSSSSRTAPNSRALSFVGSVVLLFTTSMGWMLL